MRIRFKKHVVVKRTSSEFWMVSVGFERWFRLFEDQLLIDVSDIPHVSPGDEVILIGKCGTEQIMASEFAQMAGTISNEILSRLGGRLNRTIIS